MKDHQLFIGIGKKVREVDLKQSIAFLRETLLTCRDSGYGKRIGEFLQLVESAAPCYALPGMPTAESELHEFSAANMAAIAKFNKMNQILPEDRLENAIREISKCGYKRDETFCISVNLELKIGDWLTVAQAALNMGKGIDDLVAEVVNQSDDVMEWAAIPEELEKVPVRTTNGSLGLKS